MRLVIQRVTSGCVTCAEAPPASIQKGLVVLCGLGRNDTIEDMKRCAQKILTLRLWPGGEDAQQQWKASVSSQNLEVLLVSQFTLYGSARKGTKPDFHAALHPDKARPMYEQFVDIVKRKHSSPDKVKSGVFGAMMQVDISNDGPVTIVYDTENKFAV